MMYQTVLMNLFQVLQLMIEMFRKCTIVDQIIMKLNIEIHKIHTWLMANKLTLNTIKTEFMVNNRIQVQPH